MEVLQSDTFLREEIISDAKTKAARIIKKAENDAIELEKKLETQIQEFENKYKEQIEKEVENEKNLKFASIDFEAKKSFTKFCGDIIDDIFNEIKKWIAQNNKEKELYKSIIKQVDLKIESKEGYIIEISENLLNLFQEEEIKNIKLKNSKIIAIERNKNKDGIFIFSKNKKYSAFLSLDSFINEFKSQERLNIYKILTE